MNNAFAFRSAFGRSLRLSLFAHLLSLPARLVAGFALIGLLASGCGRDSLLRPSPDSIGGHPDASGDALADGATDRSASDASSDGSSDTAPVTITSISIDPPEATLVGGSTRALVVTALYSNGTTGDVTGQVTFTTSNAAVARVNGALVTAVAVGTATITGTLGALTDTSLITVSGATVTAVAVLPGTATSAVGATVAFTADATLSDGTHQDVTASATWTSGTNTVASVAATGVATALRAGMATITASFGGRSGTATLTVTLATLTSIQVTPVDPTVGVATTLNFLATGIYSDGTRADLTAMAAWSSSAPTIVSIDASGRATTRAQGMATITATLGGRSGTSLVTVTAATLGSILVTPVASTLLVGGTAVLRAVGTYSDGSTVDLTASVVWSSTAATIAAVSNAGATAGTVTALAVGSATIRATLGAISGQATVTVSPARLVTIVVSPTAASIPVGTTVGLAAQGFFSDGTNRDVTTQVAWSSAPTAVATVSNAAGTAGLVTGVSVGSATVTATLTGVTGTATITVVGTILQSITIAPANATTTVLLRSNYTATGNYSNGTTVNLTTQVTWATGNAAIAAISNTAGAQGQLLARANGTTTVTATLAGVTGTTNVTVIGRVVNSLAIAPIAASARLGTNAPRFIATEIFSDGTQQNVSNQATWTSSMPGVATVNTNNNRGQSTLVAVGTTTITATFMGLTASTTLTVTNAVITSLSVTPISPVVRVGDPVTQFTATAIYSDGTTQNVTGAATWVSSAPGVLAVTTVGGARGRGTAVSAGTATVTATFMGIAGSTTVTVTNPVLTQIAVGPAGLTLAAGARRQFTATAIYSDGSSRDVTATAVWVSDRPAVAGVSDVAATRGQVTAVGAGTANIQATFGGISGQVGLTVTAATLMTIQVTPFNQTVPAGFSLAFQATGILTDGTTTDLTATATWVSSSPTVAGVSNAAGTRGLVSALAAGSTQISAASGGVTGSTMLTVTGATLASIAISPANPATTAGLNVTFMATGTFSDGSTLDVSAFVTWTSSNTATADVSNAAGSRGQATAFAAGTTTIQAQRGAITATTLLTVN